MNSALGSLLAFAAVIAMIPVALWLLRRTPIGQGAAQGPMKLVATLALAPNQRVVTIEVGSGEDRRWLVLGVSPGGIQPLHQMPAGAAAAAAGEPLTFAQLLWRRRSADAPQDGGHAA